MQLPKRRIYLLISTLATLGAAALFIAQGEVLATWSGFWPVLPTALFLGAVAYVLLSRTSWFYSRRRMSSWVMVVPTTCLALCSGLGIYFTEPQIQAQAQGAGGSFEQRDDYRYSRAGRWYYREPVYVQAQPVEDSGGWSDALDQIDGEALIVVVLIVVALILIVGSAFIPHFWVVSVCISLGLMYCITRKAYKRKNG